MKLIVGLGNPGKDYIQSRHNVGFIAIDKILSSNRIDVKVDMKLQSALVKTKIEGKDVIFAKPLTYMNLSGQAVLAIMNYYKIMPEDVLIILDDTALPLGKVRLRETGSHGGQNGLKDIINKLKTNNVKRLRVGIGKHEHMNTSDYVLGKFTPKEIDVIKDAMDIVLEAVTTWITTNNFNQIMTKYNTPQAD